MFQYNGFTLGGDEGGRYMRHEPILLREKRYNVLPARFLHRGEERRVWRIERAWEVRARRRQPAGHCFRVRCHDGRRYDLFHDVALNAWFVRRGVALWGEIIRNTASAKGKLRWIST